MGNFLNTNMINIFLKPSGSVHAIDDSGNKVEQYCKPWMTIIPELLKMPPKTIKWYFGVKLVRKRHNIFGCHFVAMKN